MPSVSLGRGGVPNWRGLRVERALGDFGVDPRSKQRRPLFEIYPRGEVFPMGKYHPTSEVRVALEFPVRVCEGDIERQVESIDFLNTIQADPLNNPGDLVRLVLGETLGTAVANGLPRTGTGTGTGDDR